jgi:predicted phosphodiesterase
MSGVRTPARSERRSIRGAARRAARAFAWAARVLLWVALGVGGALVGLRLAGPLEHHTALGDVRLRVEPSWHGQVDAYVPIADWGVRANAFHAPLRVRIEPLGVDRQALLRAAAGDRTVLARTERDARDAASAAVQRALIFSLGGVLAAAALGALLRAALARRRRPPRVRELIVWAAVPFAVGAALIAFTVLRATSTFDVDAFAQPSFYARGEELSQLLQVSEKVEETGKGYTSSVQRSLSGYAALLNAGANIQVDAAEDSPAVLISDLHGNTPALDALERLYADRPVFFGGDLGHTGSRDEASLLAPRLARAGSPVVAVSGNHDSRLIMRALAADGAIVLTDSGRLRADGSTDGKPVQRIGQMTVAGYPDPLEWQGRDPSAPERVFSFSERPDGEREYQAAQAGLVRWFDGLPQRPDIVMVHQNGLAQHLGQTLFQRGDGRPLLILTGHDHRQHVDLYRQIVVVDAGTGGAGGVFGIGTQSVGIATLQLPGGNPPARAVDLINVDPVSGTAQADRVVLSSGAACKVERVVCHGAESVP